MPPTYPPRIRAARCPRVALATLALVVAAAGDLPAKYSSWKDGQGGTFKGEPVEVIGPLAVFRRSTTAGQSIPLRALSPEESVQFFVQSSTTPARADTWAAATGAATKAIPGHVLRLDGDRLVSADLATRPEPVLLVVIYGSAGDGQSWNLVANFAATHERIQRAYPGLIETVFFGVRHDEQGHRGMATTMRMPWLIADLGMQRSMSALSRIAPNSERSIVVMTRHGVPLVVSDARDIHEIARFVDSLTDILRAVDPDNPHAFRDRLQFANATRPHQFAEGRSDPQLIGSLLNKQVLRAHGVNRLAAKLEVNAAGQVVTASLRQPADVTAELSKALEQAIQQSTVVSPAVDHGKPVAGTLDLVIEVPEVAGLGAADLQWMRPTVPGNVPLQRWLLLKPIPVPESSFSTLDHVDDEGAVVLTEVRASTGDVRQSQQKSAFTTNWFDAAGAASVTPKQGDKQTIDDIELTWEAVQSDGGFVNFQTLRARNYCIGYAWTEVEMASDTDAWLGIGSDDGMKIWVNGELILDKWIRRPSRLDDDIVPLHLRAGKNRLLIKIQNMTDEWSFIARLRLCR